MKENILRWAGSKHKLAEWLIEKMDVHKIYVEVFCGALNLFLQKPLAPVNVLNDINGNLINFYKVIRDESTRRLLMEEMRLMYHSRDMFRDFLTLYQSGYFKYNNGVYQAAVFLYLNRVSFGGKMDSYSPEGADNSLNIEKLYEYSKMIFRKLNYPDTDTVVENKHFRDIIPKYDKRDALIYCDPPYMTTLENGKMKYEFTMKKEEHIELRDNLYKVKEAKWLISYDNSPQVEELYKEAPYKMLTPMINWSLGNKDSDQTQIQEMIYSNYAIKNVNTLFEEKGNG